MLAFPSSYRSLFLLFLFKYFTIYPWNEASVSALRVLRAFHSKILHKKFDGTKFATCLKYVTKGCRKLVSPV
jgi:hypothetical protein